MRGAVEQRPGMAMPQNETWQKSHLEVCGAWRASRLSLCRVGGERMRTMMTTTEKQRKKQREKKLDICYPTRNPRNTSQVKDRMSKTGKPGELTNYHNTHVRVEYRYPRPRHYRDLYRDRQGVGDTSSRIGFRIDSGDRVG